MVNNCPVNLAISSIETHIVFVGSNEQQWAPPTILIRHIMSIKSLTKDLTVPAYSTLT